MINNTYTTAISSHIRLNMDLAAIIREPALKSNQPQYWVFSSSLPVATFPGKQRLSFARLIYGSISASIKRSRQKAIIFIKVYMINPCKPVTEVYGMIWITGDKKPLFDKEVILPSTIKDL